VLDSFREQILTAVRRKRTYKSIAAQYGVRIVDISEIVADELTARLDERRAA
jgi:uncharacterized protein YdbL (DUF1318 family)